MAQLLKMPVLGVQMKSIARLRCVLVTGVLLVGCNAAPAPTPLPSATSQPTTARAPITKDSPLLSVMPLSVGTTWSYTLGRSDLCLSKSTNLVVDGVMTETVESAWQQDDAIVIEVHSDSHVFDIRLQKLNYYVIVNDRLYYVLNSPARVLQSNGEGCDDALVLKWPLQVGDTFGDWTVAAEEMPEVGAVLPDTCYLLVKRSNTSAHDAWFCPGVGFVQYRDQGFVAPVSDEMRQLVEFTHP